MSYELIIYCDESIKKGKYFSNFYGGVLVSSLHQNSVNEKLNDKKISLNLKNEVKWQRVTQNYLDKYIELMDSFFDLVKDNKIKLRIMFTQNARIQKELDDYQKEHEYFLLYYQFIKHAFGLYYCKKPKGQEKVAVRLHFDRLPDTKEKNAHFKSFISNLSKNPQFRDNGIYIRNDHIAEVDSSHHVLMQCIDIVLGAMQFRLNDMHKEKPEGKFRRSKRTIAKEKLYKSIYNRIHEIYPRFNIGTTTSLQHGHEYTWKHPYRHWVFTSKKSELDRELTKRK